MKYVLGPKLNSCSFVSLDVELDTLLIVVWWPVLNPRLWALSLLGSPSEFGWPAWVPCILLHFSCICRWICRNSSNFPHPEDTPRRLLQLLPYIPPHRNLCSTDPPTTPKWVQMTSSANWNAHPLLHWKVWLTPVPYLVSRWDDY